MLQISIRELSASPKVELLALHIIYWVESLPKDEKEVKGVLKNKKREIGPRIMSSSHFDTGKQTFPLYLAIFVRLFLLFSIETIA